MRQVALFLLVVACALPPPAQLHAQALSRAQLLSAARDVMSAAPFVAFATVDEQGRPAVRAMDALAPDGDLIVWFATNPRSRKVGQLRADPRVALHYLDADGPGYVTLNGVARLVEDPAQKAGRWKESWTPFYADRDASVILIEVTPLWLEVVSVPHGANGDPDDWRADIVEFVPGSSGR